MILSHRVVAQRSPELGTLGFCWGCLLRNLPGRCRKRKRDRLQQEQRASACFSVAGASWQSFQDYSSDGNLRGSRADASRLERVRRYVRPTLARPKYLLRIMIVEALGSSREVRWNLVSAAEGERTCILILAGGYGSGMVRQVTLTVWQPLGVIHEQSSFIDGPPRP